MTDWTIIARSLRSRLFSTVTTVITVAVAVALMLVLLTMRGAARKSFERGGGNMHLLLSRDASPLVSVLNGVFYVKPPQAYIMWREYEQFMAQTPVLAWGIPAQLGDSYLAKWPVLATTPEFFSQYKPDPAEPWQFREGAVFTGDFQIVLGATVARATGLKLHDKIVLTHGFPAADAPAHVHDEYKYEVVGILKPTGQAHDRAMFTSLMSTWIIHAHDRREKEERLARGGADESPEEHENEKPMTAADVTDEDRKITNILVRAATRPGKEATAIEGKLYDQLRKGQGFPGTVTVAMPGQEMVKLMDIVGNVDLILLAVAGVVMVSSGIAIMLALYNSMEQRRRQIAVLRVLGASQGRVFGLVVTESAIIGLMGAAVGVITAMFGAWGTASIMKDRLGVSIDPALDPRAAIAVSIGAILLAALAGLAPAIVAYRTSVGRNLRPIG